MNKMIRWCDNHPTEFTILLYLVGAFLGFIQVVSAKEPISFEIKFILVVVMGGSLSLIGRKKDGGTREVKKEHAL